MSIFSDNKSRAIQLYHRPDSNLQFRQVQIEDSDLVQHDQKGMVCTAWPYFMVNQFAFNGHKGMPAGMVTLSFDRDIILDPFGVLEDADKPEKGKGKYENPLIKDWIIRKGESQRYKAQNKPGSMLLVEKITMWLGIALILELLLGVALPATMKALGN